MSRRHQLPYNAELAKVTDDQVLLAMAKIERAAEEYREKHGFYHSWDIDGYSDAQRIAGAASVAPAIRGGRGAVAGSWSGFMAPALRVAPRLRSMAKRGLLDRKWNNIDRRGVYEYRMTDAGRARLAEIQANAE
jgi:hypothetical protein